MAKTHHIYHLSFSFVQSMGLGNRKFKHNDNELNDSTVTYPLCTECEQYLTRHDNYQNEQYCWPSFLCSLLSNERCHNVYGNYIWRLIPTEFRYWWVNYIRDAFPQVFHEATIEFPSPIFDNVSMWIKRWNEGLNTSTLPSLTSICNEMIIPTIMCPWGDSVFLHNTGTLPIDIVLQYTQRKVQFESRIYDFLIFEMRGKLLDR